MVYSKKSVKSISIVRGIYKTLIGLTTAVITATTIAGCGGATPTKTPTLTPPTHTPSPSPTYTQVVIPTDTPASTPTQIIIPTATATPTSISNPNPTSTQTQTPLPATETPVPVNLEYDMIVSGWLVRERPEYDALWNFINKRTGVDRHNIARVILYDSRNQMQVDWIRPDGSVAFDQPYIVELSEQGVDDVIWKLTKQYRKEIVLIPDSRLEAILESQGHSLEGLAELLMKAQPKLTKEQILQFLEDNYAITLNPNIYSGVNTDLPMVAIIASEEVSEPPQQIRVNEELYEEILDYVKVPTQQK